jgi:hypothetical protein
MSTLPRARSRNPSQSFELASVQADCRASLLAEAGSGALTAATSYLRGDMGGVFSALGGLAKKAVSGNKGQEISRRTKTSPADCISFSGCKDDQTSADTSEAGKATGAMSFALISALSQYPQQSYLQLLNSVRDILRAKCEFL